jgi:protein-S-isoprenylcysteine O-methyltransferase Ste14
MSLFINGSLFIVGTALLAWISRHDLRRKNTHGFYRFWAWECLLLLFLHNRAVWFVDRFAAHQLLSWGLLFLSIALVVSGAVMMHRHGQANAQRTDHSLLPFEKTTQLVQCGIYAHIRHPLYASLLCLAWGLFFKQPTWWLGAALATVASLCLLQTACVEEQENLAYFGDAYRSYMARTRRFLPYLW